MSVYHLHARRHEGELGAPDARYLFESRESDDVGEITRSAKELAEQGYTTIIYDHGNRAALPGASDYRQVAKFWPDGRVERDASYPVAARGGRSTAPVPARAGMPGLRRHPLMLVSRGRVPQASRKGG